MEERVLIQGEAIAKGKGLRYFLPAGVLWGMTLLYAGFLYGKNVKNCSYAFSDASCFPKWNHSFLEFLKMSMGPNTFFVSLTVLLWCAVLCLLAGAGLYFAFKNNALAVINCRICGKAVFGAHVELPLSKVLAAEKLPGHLLKLRMPSGSILSGPFQNQEAVCRLIEEQGKLQKRKTETGIKAEARGLPGWKLAVLCFLPFFLLSLPILLSGEPSLGKSWELYWGQKAMQARFDFLSYWLAEQMSQRNHWPSCLIYAGFPALLAGGFCFFACSRQKIRITEGRVQGRGSFQAAFDLPLMKVKEGKKGWFHSVIFDHSYGKIRIYGIKNRTEILDCFHQSVHLCQETEEVPEAPEAASVSDKKLGILCFLPVLLFFILFTIGISRNVEFCRETFQHSASIREKYTYAEYLLIWALMGDLGRWIKAFFWLSLVGLSTFFADRGSVLRVQKGRILGRSRWGGYLDAEMESICGISVTAWGTLTLFTTSGKFVFGGLKNSRELFTYLRNEMLKPAEKDRNP